MAHMSIGVFCVEVCRGDKALVGKESKPQKKALHAQRAYP